MTFHQPGRSLRKPSVLSVGDKVALISPSSHMGEAAGEQIQDALTILQGWGLEVAPLPEKEPRHLFFAGSDEERAKQFEVAYLDPDIKALFFTRGGYGATRILPLLTAEAISIAEPKSVVGFSDATALFAWLSRVAGISSLHGPCVAAPSLLNSETREDDLSALKQALFNPDDRPVFSVKALNQKNVEATTVEGNLIGGCLAVLTTTLGTPWEIDTQDAVLFLEDIGEAPYRVDRMLAHLRTAGKLDHVRGIVFGHMTHCDSDPPGLLLEVLQDFFKNDPFPIAWGLPAGHGSPNRALWLGQPVQLDIQSDGEAQLAFTD